MLRRSGASLLCYCHRAGRVRGVSSLTVLPADGEAKIAGTDAKVKEFQSNIRVDGTKVSGTLKYVKGKYYPLYQDESDGEGNYLILDIYAPPETVIDAQLLGGSKTVSTVLFEDGLLMFRIEDPKKQTIKLTTKNGNTAVEKKTLTLTDLVCEPKEE